MILGGTHQYKDFNIKVSQTDDKFITDGCQRLIPGMKHAPLLKQWVGLRPGRSSIRLEKEFLAGSEVSRREFSHWPLTI